MNAKRYTQGQMNKPTIGPSKGWRGEGKFIVCPTKNHHVIFSLVLSIYILVIAFYFYVLCSCGNLISLKKILLNS